MIELTPEQTETYISNDNANFHTENIVMLTNITGNKDLISEAKEIQEMHTKEWYISYNNAIRRGEIYKQIYKLINLPF